MGSVHLHHFQSRSLLLFVVALAAAAAGWVLTALFVADDFRAAVIALPLWLAAGVALGSLAVAVRERSRARDVAERRLDVVAEATSDAIVRLDADGIVRSFNPGAERLWGHAGEDVVGRAAAELLGEPDAERIVESVRNGERVHDVMDLHADGRSLAASITVVPSELDGDAILVARDVDEVRRLTGELRNAEATYRSLTEHLPLVTYVQSPGGERETISVSPQIDRLVGYTPEEWLADPGLFLRLVHPDDREAVAAARDTADVAEKRQATYRLVSRDGRIVWVHDEAVAVLDESGRPFVIQGYLLDVTARKTAEADRKELLAAEAAVDATARDRQRKLERVAEAAAALGSSLDARAAVEEAAALAVREFADWCAVDVLEEDGTLVRFAAARAEPSSLRGEPAAEPEPAVSDVIDERRPRLSDSEIRVPMFSRAGRALGALSLMSGEGGRPYVSQDLPWARALAGVIALALDNSRLHVEVEARSDANKVLRHVGDGVFFLDRGGLIRLWNPAAAAITGVPAETAVGKPVSEAIVDWQEVGERVPVGTTQEPARAATLPLETPRGERWISISGVDFFGGTVYAFRDITEEHRLDELKAEFIATASHELRTPLAAVYGAAQTLRRHDFALDDAGRERFISMIVDESDRLASIVNQILLANQLEVGRLDLVTEPFDATDLVERVVESARTHAPPHIDFDVKFSDGMPLVAADKDRARQVLVNLVENAVKYSPGGGLVEVRLEPADGAVVFRVADEGLGVPANEQRQIFEKFYRLDPNMTQGIGGTGLGLYICSELVERMDGEIWLDSEEGKGSTFSFKLPSVGASAVFPKLREGSGAN